MAKKKPDYKFSLRFFNDPFIEKRLSYLAFKNGLSKNKLVVKIVSDYIMKELGDDTNDLFNAFIKKDQKRRHTLFLINAIHSIAFDVFFIGAFILLLIGFFGNSDISLGLLLFCFLMMIVIPIINYIIRCLFPLGDVKKIEVKNYQEFVKFCNRKLYDPIEIIIKPKEAFRKIKRIKTEYGDLFKVNGKDDEIEVDMLSPYNCIPICLNKNIIGFFEKKPSTLPILQYES